MILEGAPAAGAPIVCHDWNSMKLRDFAGILPVEEATASASIDVTGVSSDSRDSRPGHAVLRPGRLEGRRRGLCGRRGKARRARPSSPRNGARLADARRAGDRSRRSAAGAGADGGALLRQRSPTTMVAVTGTSGKTSVASFTRQIWEQAGKAAASIGTTGVVAPGRNEYGALTTPDPVALHRLLAELADAGVTHAAMEASSHGLDQRRLDGVRLAAGAFTNLGRDHMDYHPTVEDYHDAKLRLFEALLPKGAPAVIFADDPWSRADHRSRQARRPRRADRRAARAPSSSSSASSTSAIASAPRSRRTASCMRSTCRWPAISRSTTRWSPPDWRSPPERRPPRRLRRSSNLKGAPGRLELVGTAAERRAGLCRLCAQARRAGERAGLGAALHHRPRHRGVRLRRRPRPRQAADHGRDRDAARRRGDRHRRQSALRGSRDDPRGDPGGGARRDRDRRPPQGDPRGRRHARCRAIR